MAARVARGRLWAVAGSLAAHLVLFAIALWGLWTPGPPPQPEAVQVELVCQPLSPVRPPARPERRGSGVSPAVPSPPPPRTETAAGPASVRPAPGLPPAQADAAGAVRPLLRSALGCEHADFLGLSPEERRRCQEKIANRRDSAELAFNLDPRGLYDRDPNQEPYLVRKPKNGCKVRAAGDHAPMGQSGAAAGVSCGKTF